MTAPAARPAAHLSGPLQQISALLRERTGITFEADRTDYLQRRMTERMRALDISDASAYVTRVSTDNAELQELTNLVTVNESSFFREEHQFRCLTKSLLPALEQGGYINGSLRLWSVPCANGEEPYSLALHLLEHYPQVDKLRVDIVASDIDTSVLRAAAQGIYEPRVLARVPAALLLKYFTRLGGDRFQICQGLRSSIDFCHLNLTRGTEVAAIGSFHIIFCRNVLFYFDEQTRQEILKRLANALLPGGFLCLGHSEMLGKPPHGLVARRFPDATVYQRLPEGAHR